MYKLLNSISKPNLEKECEIVLLMELAYWFVTGSILKRRHRERCTLNMEALGSLQVW